MTEREWLECADPKRMLKVLRGKIKVSDRKLRLLACGCCRRIWKDLTLQSVRPAIETAEQYADLAATDQELAVVHQRGVSAVVRSLHRNVDKMGKDTAYDTKMRRMGLAMNAAYPGPVRINLLRSLGDDEVSREFGPIFLRCVIGNPFRPIFINPAWLAPIVATLASSAYDERILPTGELDAARLGVLSDALEEAGCDAADILNHLRSPGPHVRGCWPVDLLLGKK